MIDTSLINLLKSFDLATWHQAEKFVRSPFHNHREDVVKLLDYLQSKRPLDNVKHLQQEVVFKKVFPSQSFDEKKLRYTRSFLYQLLLEMLAYAAIKEEPAGIERYTVQALRVRGLEKELDANLQDAHVALHKQPKRDILFYYQQYAINAERYAFENSRKRSSDVHFQEYSDAFSIYFMIERLRQSCTALSHRVFARADFQQDFLPEIIRLIEEHNYDHAPALMVYYHGYKALTSVDGTANFRQLRALISAHASAFSAAERRDIYLLAINYCIRQTNAGNHYFLEDVLDLYREGLDNEAFMDNKYLSRYTYTNITLAGIGLRQFDWTEAFIHKYRSSIEPRFQESAYHYNLALLFFRKPDYDKVLVHLRQVEFKDVLHNLDARRMLLRIYFDRRETEALFSLLDSFSIFLKRQKGLGYHREHYVNLLKYTRRLLQIPPKDVQARAELREEIEQTTQLAEKKWLLEQLS